MGSFKSHSFKKNILQVVAAIVNTLLQADSDISHYSLNSNMRYWSGANPREIHQRPLHSDRVTVWCAISRIRIIGPYFFDEDDRAVTVNSERYVAMIQEFFAPVLEELNAGLVWFQ